MKVWIPTQLVAECLVSDDRARQQRSAGALGEERGDDCIDQAGNLGKQTAIVAEEYPEGLRHREHELPVRKVQENLVRQVLGEQ